MSKINTILIDALHTFIGKDTGVFFPLYELLETYACQKIICTNAGFDQIVTYGMDLLPYDLFTMEHSPNKSSPLYFETLLATYCLLPEQVVYIEHNLAAVCSARSCGIASYRYDMHIKDLEACKQFLDSFAIPSV